MLFSASAFITFSLKIASRLFQNRAGMPSTISNLTAVSGVNCTSPLINLLICFSDMSILAANSFWLIPLSFNCSFIVTPGGVAI